MHRTHSYFVRAAALILLSALIAGCRTKTASIGVPSAPAPEVKAAELLVQGDAQFAAQHLYGWQKAEALYEQAYSLHKLAATKEKLLLTRFLIMTRRMDEDIPDPGQLDTVRELCSASGSARNALLCDLARRYSRGIWLKATAGQESGKIRVDRSLFAGDDAVVGASLYSFCARADILEIPPEGFEAVSDQYKDSPLFVYLDFARRGAQKLAEAEKAHPQFAELFDYMGEELFQKRKYNGARSYFRRAVELIPGYTRSLNGLGNVYSFALEDYERALGYYNAALKFEPMNTASLFGKGAALHHLGSFEESNRTLDLMFQTDLTRKGYSNANNVRYYQGEGHYIQAYNHYLNKDPGKARELVEVAKKYIPESEEANYLSGVLYYEEKNIEAARGEFLKVVQRGNSNCSAQRYLGLIFHQDKGLIETQTAADLRMPKGGEYDKLRKLIDERAPEKESGPKRALNYFLSSSSCMDKAIRSLGDQIKMVPSLDLEEGEKVILGGKLEKKLFDYRLSSDSMIRSMLMTVAGDEIEGKQVYTDAMTEILARISLQGAGNH
jgi:tetratricopeptide (TPR) repeat protein